MPQYIIANYKNLMKSIPRSEIDNIQVPSGYVLCFYDGSNLMIKNSDGIYIPCISEGNNTTLILKRPPIDDKIFLKLYVSPNGSFNNLVSAVDTSTEQGRQRCKAYVLSIEGGASWEDLPNDGLSIEYSDAPIKIDLSGIQYLPGYIFYRWETEQGSDREYNSMFFPSSVELQGIPASNQNQYECGVVPKGLWQSDVQYYENDMITYQGNIYVALRDNVDVTPGTSNEDWMAYTSNNA